MDIFKYKNILFLFSMYLLILCLLYGLQEIVYASDPNRKFFQVNNSRAEELVSSFEKIAKNKNIILFYGMSDVLNSFNPVTFDKQLEYHNIRGTSFNFTFHSTFYKTLYYLSENFSQHLLDRKVEVTYIKFQVGRLSKKSEVFYETFQKDIELQLAANLISPSSLFITCQTDIKECSQLLIYKYFYKNIDIMGIRDRIFQYPDPYNRIDYQKDYAPQTRAEFIEDTGWSYEKRGFYDYNRSNNEYKYQDLVVKHFQNDTILNGTIYSFTLCCDIIDPDFSEKYVSDLTELIRSAKKYSKKVVLVHFPVHPFILEKRKQETMSKIDILLKTITTSEKISLIQTTGNFFDKNDFLDAVHLSDTGREKFQSWLVQATVPLLTEEVGNNSK